MALFFYKLVKGNLTKEETVFRNHMVLRLREEMSCFLNSKIYGHMIVFFKESYKPLMLINLKRRVTC